MLRIVIPDNEYFLPESNEFVIIKGKVLQLEHSLISVSKWESKWKKAFLKKDKERTQEQMLDYVKCMTLTQNVDPKVYLNVTPSIMRQINEYINDPMTATVIAKLEQNGGNVGASRDTVTSELIYYWMISLNIPFECQKWHLNRLLALIEVCNMKNSKPAKLTPAQKKAQRANWSAINAARRAKSHSKG